MAEARLGRPEARQQLDAGVHRPCPRPGSPRPAPAAAWNARPPTLFPARLQSGRGAGRPRALIGGAGAGRALTGASVSSAERRGRGAARGGLGGSVGAARGAAWSFAPGRGSRGAGARACPAFPALGSPQRALRGAWSEGAWVRAGSKGTWDKGRGAEGVEFRGRAARGASSCAVSPAPSQKPRVSKHCDLQQPTGTWPASTGVRTAAQRPSDVWEIPGHPTPPEH